MTARFEWNAAQGTRTDALALAAPESFEPDLLLAFRALRCSAVETVVRQMVAQPRSDAPTNFVPWDFCREQLGRLLEFLEPSMEFGLLQPIADHLDWSSRRSSPQVFTSEQLAWALQAFAEFFLLAMDARQGRGVADMIGAAHAVFVGSRRPRDPPSPGGGGREALDFGAALVEGRQDDAVGIMERHLRGGRGLVEFGVHVLQPAMHEVGRRWLEESLPVSVEHRASAIARNVLAIGMASAPRPPPNGRSVVLACVEGNDHDLGLHLVADAYRLAGWRVDCLGGNVPTSDLVRFVATRAPDVLGLSVAFAYQLRLVRSIVAGVQSAALQRGPLVLAGGAAAVRYERIALGLGAHAVARDAADAVAQSSRLLQ
jgi:methanogenic corrinoid protein MtbC1